jgi:hypothetical protein
MLDNEIINHMDIEELRNYVAHQEAVINSLLGLNGDNADIIEELERALHAMNYRVNATAVYNARQGELSWIEQELRKKYEQYFAQKVCTMEAPCTNCKEGQG